jgi:DNA-binding FadR family transcriptional regulator
MATLVEAKDHFGVAEEDFAFHKTVWKASGNDVLAATLERLCVAVYAFVSLKRHAAGESMRSAVKSHTLLFKALMSGDADRVTQGIREHLTSTDVIPESIAE